MKTVGELRKLISECDGKLIIGKIYFAYKEEGDIDINLDGKLASYIRSSVSDETNLADGCIDYIYDFWDKLEPKDDDKDDVISLLKDKVAELEKENVEIKECAVSYSKKKGMVEAYEKILIGRELTVGK